MKPSCRVVLAILTMAALAIDARPAGAQPKVAAEQIGPLEVVRASVSRVLTIVQAPYPGASGGSQRRALIPRVPPGRVRLLVIRWFIPAPPVTGRCAPMRAGLARPLIHHPS